jgi:hypothetical protein
VEQEHKGNLIKNSNKRMQLVNIAAGYATLKYNSHLIYVRNNLEYPGVVWQSKYQCLRIRQRKKQELRELNTPLFHTFKSCRTMMMFGGKSDSKLI